MKGTWLVIVIFLFGCKADLKENGYSIGNEGLHALIVYQHDAVQFEKYLGDRTADDFSNIQSTTKSIMSLLVGIAIDKGFIKNEDQELGDLLPDLFTNIEDARKRKITIKNVLNQRTSLEWEGHLEFENWLSHEDPNYYVLNKDLVADPQTVYNYNSGATHLLSVMISKMTNMSTLAFAQQYLFDHLGIREVRWEQLNDGNYDGGGLGLAMRPADLLKIGLLVSNHGLYDGEQIVSRSWMDKIYDPTLKSDTEWGVRGSSHGYCWYQAEVSGKEVVYSMGFGGQFIIIVPEEDLIVVSTFEHDTPTGLRQQRKFLSKNLKQIIALHTSH